MLSNILNDYEMLVLRIQVAEGKLERAGLK
jgi:hypothetical protein